MSTHSVHADEKRDPEGAIHPPLYSHSTCAFGSTADLLDVVEDRTPSNLYTRYSTRPSARYPRAQNSSAAICRNQRGLEEMDAFICLQRARGTYQDRSRRRVRHNAPAETAIA